MLTVDRNSLPGMKPTRHSFCCGQPLGPGVACHNKMSGHGPCDLACLVSLRKISRSNRSPRCCQGRYKQQDTPLRFGGTDAQFLTLPSEIHTCVYYRMKLYTYLVLANSSLIINLSQYEFIKVRLTLMSHGTPQNRQKLTVFSSQRLQFGAARVSHFLGQIFACLQLQCIQITFMPLYKS